MGAVETSQHRLVGIGGFMSHGTVPRQPRSSCASNQARKIQINDPGGILYVVQCKTCGGSWSEVATFRDGTQADNMVSNLNGIFAIDNADLDFIHIHRAADDQYRAVWSGVKWFNDHSNITELCDTSKKTYEPLYKANGITVIKNVTQADENFYGRDPWSVAYLWVKNIKAVVNGWNCSKDATNLSLIASGFIPVPPTQTNWSRGTISKAGSHYGLGECQPNLATANGEIFHTMDFIIAVPNDETWGLNEWVKVTFNGKSARARVTDRAGRPKIDLSRGLSEYLNFQGSGTITLSNP